jgi:hypothetical protein
LIISSAGIRETQKILAHGKVNLAIFNGPGSTADDMPRIECFSEFSGFSGPFAVIQIPFWQLNCSLIPQYEKCTTYVQTKTTIY